MGRRELALKRNFHAHILTTTRQVEATGLGVKTSIEWADTDRAKRGLKSGQEEIAEVRERWAVVTNEKLQALGHEARVDYRSLEAQGIDREPTVHLGPAVNGMQRRGTATDVGERIKAEAQARLEFAAELGRLQREAEQIHRSIIEISTDIRAALARESWLEYREQQAQKDKDADLYVGAEVTADRQKNYELPDDDVFL